MKVEIGESIIYSWLRHIKKCEVAQTNWKISPTWVIKPLPGELLNSIPQTFGTDIFKRSVNIDQVIKQAEIDVFGYSFSENKIYAIDVAFHENGLSYGNAEETIKRVRKKILRSALVILGCFGKIESEIIFSSPKINKDRINGIRLAIQEIDDFLGPFNILCHHPTGA
ncbi:MAG: hypothetical protein AB7E49_06600 [Campylobacterales bacterium]